LGVLSNRLKANHAPKKAPPLFKWKNCREQKNRRNNGNWPATKWLESWRMKSFVLAGRWKIGDDSIDASDNEDSTRQHIFLGPELKS
jgi:hypothetical protein